MTSKRTDVRVDLNRDKQGKWRWAARVPGHVLAVSSESYSRRIDCLTSAQRVVGDHDVAWWDSTDGNYRYGQSSNGRVEFFIWKPRRWHR